MTVSIKREYTVISGTQNIGLSIYDSPPPSGTTFAITGGRDQDLFTIDPATGSLSFRSAKFYQSPKDFDRNGIYDVVITATESDGTETSSSIGIEVSLDNILPDFRDTVIGYEINADGATVIQITGVVTDTLSGLIGGRIGFTLEHEISGQTINLTDGDSDVTLDEVGNYQLSYTMDAGLPNGMWYVSYFLLEDKAGNSSAQYYTGADSSILSADLPNGLYLGTLGGSAGEGVDSKVPSVSNLNVTTQLVTVDGIQKLQAVLTGKIDSDISEDWGNNATFSFQFKPVENPSAKTMQFYGYSTIGTSNHYADENGNFRSTVVLDDKYVSGTYYLDRWLVTDRHGNQEQHVINSGGTGSPLLELSFLVADDPTDIKFDANSVSEKTEGFLLGELIINDNDNDGASSGPTAQGTYAYNTNHLYTYEITGEDKDLIEISSFGYLRIKSDAKVYRYQDQTLDFNITATSPAGVSYTEAFSIPVEAYQHTITYSNGTKTLPGLKLTMTESDGTITELTADNDGKLTLPTTSNTYSLKASYEGSGNDPISLVDAIQILQYGGELRTLTPAQLKAADVNSDGEVDILDAIWILQHLGELRTLDTGFMFLDGATGKALSETTFNPEDTPDIKIVRKGDVDGDFEPTVANASASSLESSSIDIRLDYDESISFDNTSDSVLIQDPEMDLNDLIDITPEAENPYQSEGQEFNIDKVNIENYKDPIFQKTVMVFIEEPKENEILIYPDLI